MIDSLRQKLKELKLDALFVSGQENVTYLTGILGLSASEREAYLLITPAQIYLLAYTTTIGMYRETSGFDLVELTVDFPISEAINCLARNFKQLAFEKNNLTCSEFESLKNKVKLELTPSENIIEDLRLFK